MKSRKNIIAICGSTRMQSTQLNFQKYYINSLFFVICFLLIFSCSNNINTVSTCNIPIDGFGIVEPSYYISEFIVKESIIYYFSLNNI